MFTIFTVLIMVVIVGVLLLFIGALLRGKAQKITITCSLILLLSFVLFSKDWFGPRQEYIDYMLGQYRIDTTNLKYPKEIVRSYADLTLLVSNDLTFKLSRTSPYFKSTTGTWTVEAGTDFELVKFKLDNEKWEEDMLLKNESWSLKSQDTTQQYILFRKIKAVQH
ncbi:hypothetical protein IC229_20575 [Spirosoma sp. BT702]|uniref:Uncharacterized protein n=1 Tax=Spirosoma profusum TaxID=2771354 RepID=A0A926XY29_9BACT|nr:hypothetical protein [Spirosoma profusum]MBD2703054.1 hypothetical protein [Spirosoma profusum]